MGSSVRVKEAVIVTPSEPTPARVLALSSLDSQLFLRFTIEYLFVYEPCPFLDQGATAACLKAALARALVPYYPFAGRVRSRPDGSCLEVLCRAQGALFVEAFSDHYAINDFGRAPKTVTHWRKLLSLCVPDVLNGSPPLVIQLTWLRDGAAALGVGINHCICDGIGSAEFLNYFAGLASGTDFKPKPVWERHLLNPSPMKHNRASSTVLPEFSRVPDLCRFMSRVCNDLKPTSITFDKIRLNELKNLASLTSGPSELSSSSYTSFEVLAGHVWRSWARALGFPSNQILKLLFSVNIRNRVKPGIPDGYYGNAFVLGCAQTSTKELTEKGLGYATGLVKRAKERANSEHVTRVIDSVSESMACPDSVGVLIVSQWSRLGLESVDFGMGKPLQVGPVCCDRYCLFLPVKGEREAAKVMVAVPTGAVDKYHYLLSA
ncbi:hypothetical protein L6164_029749 [Bauhinia variegata]|uniref:Uncharacterized protein n=1 Tax=Bauhinia variegata TaxID=167791 RepID=A0ACB9L9M1_BAUVA|nr:hypothetical protein L6164_029749 [Bauhinia variegata]